MHQMKAILAALLTLPDKLNAVAQTVIGFNGFASAGTIQILNSNNDDNVSTDTFNIHFQSSHQS